MWPLGLEQGRGGLGQSGFKTNSCSQGGEGSGEISSPKLFKISLYAGVPVGVVDEGVEGLIEPLPEHDLGRGPVELEHGAGDEHPPWHLE